MTDRYYYQAWPFEHIAEAALRLVVAAESQNAAISDGGKEQR